MRVRPATIVDVPELARVHTESSEAAYAGLAPPDPDGLVRRARTWREVVGQSEYEPFVIEHDGVVVGVLNVGPAQHGEDAGELYTIYVHPDYWGSGAGQALLEAAHEALAKRWDEAVLTVLAANPRARRFYERNGWMLEHVQMEPHFGGIPIEVAKYRKRFIQVPGT